MHKGNCAAHSGQGDSFIDCILPWLPGFVSYRKESIYSDAVGNPGGYYAILMNQTKKILHEDTESCFGKNCGGKKNQNQAC